MLKGIKGLWCSQGRLECILGMSEAAERIADGEFKVREVIVKSGGTEVLDSHGQPKKRGVFLCGGKPVEVCTKAEAVRCEEQQGNQQ